MGDDMAWDFETEPEFEAKLQWMREFIEREIAPLEPILGEIPVAEWTAVKRHLQEQVKAEGLWGAFLDPKLGGPGFGQLKLAAVVNTARRVSSSRLESGVHGLNLWAQHTSDL